MIQTVDFNYGVQPNNCNKKRQPRKARSTEALIAILCCKGGPMRAKQARRAKDTKHNQIHEGW